VIERGMGGPSVTSLQQRLNAAGATPALAADGKFGPKTEAALRAFQGSRGLPVDGKLNQATLAALGTTGSSLERSDSARARSGAGTTVGNTGGTRAPSAQDLSRPPEGGQLRAGNLQHANPVARGPGVPSGPQVETRREGSEIPRGQQQAPIPDYKPCARPTPAVVGKANEILKQRLPVGSTVEFESGGKKYTARMEWHKHAATDNVPAALKDWHRGVTVYEAK